jgi:ParB-like chromosome segregation protein Spo0J
MKMLRVDQLSLHPEAHRIPRMRADEYAEFARDVRERGIRVPLELQPGTKTVLDGRHRLTVARETGIAEVPTVDAPLDGDDPVLYMIRAASKRRHLDDGQRAMLADEERRYLAERSKKHRAQKAVDAREEKAGRKPISETAWAPKIEERSRKQAARSHNVSERKVRQAQKVRDHSPDLAEKVKNGDEADELQGVAQPFGSVRHTSALPSARAMAWVRSSKSRAMSQSKPLRLPAASERSQSENSARARRHRSRSSGARAIKCAFACASRSSGAGTARPGRAGASGRAATATRRWRAGSRGRGAAKTALPSVRQGPGVCRTVLIVDAPFAAAGPRSAPRCSPLNL